MDVDYEERPTDDNAGNEEQPPLTGPPHITPLSIKRPMPRHSHPKEQLKKKEKSGIAQIANTKEQYERFSGWKPVPNAIAPTWGR